MLHSLDTVVLLVQFLVELHAVDLYYQDLNKYYINHHYIDNYNPIHYHAKKNQNEIKFCLLNLLFLSIFHIMLKHSLHIHNNFLLLLYIDDEQSLYNLIKNFIHKKKTNIFKIKSYVNIYVHVQVEQNFHNDHKKQVLKKMIVVQNDEEHQFSAKSNHSI